MELRSEIQSCQRCPLYQELPDGCKPVPGVGRANASVMLVGEALGEDESIWGEPFVGIAGDMLNSLLKKSGLVREKVFINNSLRCRPTSKDGKTNRPPSRSEIKACKQWLWEEIKEVKPKVIVTLGKVPTQLLLNDTLKSTFKLKTILGQEFKVDFNGLKTVIVPNYHPSFLMQYGKQQIDDATKVFSKIKAVYG